MSLGRAVQILARQTGCPVLVDPILLAGRNSLAVKGAYTAQNALIHLFGPMHVDVTATISGLGVSPLDAETLASGDAHLSRDDSPVETSRLLLGDSHASPNRSATRPQEPVSSHTPA